MKHITNFFNKLDGIVNIFIWMFMMIVLGYSAITSTPVLEIENFDSQWWILFLVTIMWTKKGFGRDEK